MTDKQPEALRLADELEEPLHDFPEPTTLESEAAAELRRLHSENETLRMGYDAARLEIESLKAQLHAAKQINAAQFGLLTASIPGSALRACHGQAPAGESLRTDALCDLSYSHGLKAGWNYCASDDLAGFERAQKIGAEALRTLKSPTAQAAPAAVAGPSEAVAYLDIGTGGYLDLSTDLSDEAVSRLPKGRHALVIAGTYGIDGYTAALTTQPSPAAQGDALSDDAVRVPLDSLHADAAYLIGRLREGTMPYARVIEIIRERIDAAKAAIRARAAQGDALDAARLDWLLLRISGAEFRRIGVHYSGNASRAAVDAARKQGANHD